MYCCIRPNLFWYDKITDYYMSFLMVQIFTDSEH